jgi:hypothetical protein
MPCNRYAHCVSPLPPLTPPPAPVFGTLHPCSSARLPACLSFLHVGLRDWVCRPRLLSPLFCFHG